MQQWQKKLQALAQWWQTPAGRRLLQLEKKYLRQVLQNLFGYQLVLIADDNFADLSNASRMRQVLRIDPFTQNINVPLNNVDAIIIPHVLLYLPGINDWLQAIQRKLEANGRIIITGYHYLSCLGWQRLTFNQAIRGLPQQRYNSRKLRFWLQKNNFYVDRYFRFGSCAQKPVAKADAKIVGALLGNIFCIVASKQLVTVKTFKTKKWQQTSMTHSTALNPFVGKSCNYDR